MAFSRVVEGTAQRLLSVTEVAPPLPVIVLL